MDDARELRRKAEGAIMQADQLVKRAKADHRELTTREAKEVEQLIAEHDAAVDRAHELEGIDPHKWSGGVAERLSRGNESMGRPPRRGGETIHRNDGDLRIIRGGKPEDRKFSAMLGADRRYTGGFNSFGEMVNLVANRMNDQRLQRSMTEGSVSDGGALVPAGYASEVWDSALEGEVVRPRCTIIDMSKYKSNELNIPAWVLGDHSSNLYGGIVTYWKHEGGTLTESDPEPRLLKFKAKKLTGLCKISDELIEDAGGLINDLTTTFGSALGWELDDKFLNGSGSGEPLGILNGPCLKEVSKESGQTSGFVYENALNMIAGLPAQSFMRAAWFCHPTVIPWLGSMAVNVGTGGSHIPVLKESNGEWSLLTRPVVFTEKLPAVGTAGDVLLADMTQYVVAMRSELRIDSSIYPYFTTGYTAMRFVTRVDGMPGWDEVLTLKDGSTTVSPFVVCETRS